MSVETKGGGVTTLSALTIDADKDWAAKGITNLKELAAGMAIGDLLVRNLTKLERLQPGPIGYGFTSAGPLHIPSWQPFPVAGVYYYPAPIMSSHTEAIKAVAQSVTKNAALASILKKAYSDDPADLIRRFDATLASAHAENVIAAVDESITKNARIKSGLSILCDGFVEETAAAAQTDHTAEARSGAANDLNLCPMSDTVLDKIYIGSNYKFWQAQIQVGTGGAGNWTNVTYYWNGAWAAVVDENDGSNSFQHGAGLKFISHTPQGDWALSNIMGMNLYWLMIRTDNWINRVTKPLGSQIWVAIA
ncbi:MAG: hypothetical protein PHI12_07355 [Dehalococcoidales bacterium]|nr:hypothetical protein [Dehalococcoidales bacterium]